MAEGGEDQQMDDLSDFHITDPSYEDETSFINPLFEDTLTSDPQFQTFAPNPDLVKLEIANAKNQDKLIKKLGLEEGKYDDDPLRRFSDKVVFKNENE